MSALYKSLTVVHTIRPLAKLVAQQLRTAGVPRLRPQRCLEKARVAGFFFEWYDSHGKEWKTSKIAENVLVLAGQTCYLIRSYQQ